MPMGWTRYQGFQPELKTLSNLNSIGLRFEKYKYLNKKCHGAILTHSAAGRVANGWEQYWWEKRCRKERMRVVSKWLNRRYLEPWPPPFSRHIEKTAFFHLFISYLTMYHPYSFFYIFISAKGLNCIKHT